MTMIRVMTALAPTVMITVRIQVREHNPRLLLFLQISQQAGIIFYKK